MESKILEGLADLGLAFNSSFHCFTVCDI